ncbi:hypothetical protein IM40_04055 [Candidatus Paracaedimonas acanthamoebae]|nr:hypothetical protein IM40_04055 [Candidatus Paracaedimonas acanthamoebae]
MKYLSQFLESLSAERGYALNTLEAYARDIKDFNIFLKGKVLEEVKKTDIQQYLLHLKERIIASSSRARKLSALRQFFSFLVEEEVIFDNPTLLIDLPKQERRLPKTLTEEEVFALIEATRELDSRERVRLSCLLEILYATGMRVSELVSLHLKTALLALRTAQEKGEAFFIIKGKGNVERLTPLTSSAIKALEDYLKVRETFEVSVHGKKWLFPSRSVEGHLTRQRFGQLLKSFALQAGIPSHRISPHVIRHAFATHLLHHGADLLSVQKLLGHADISTTQIYTHVMEVQKQKLVFDHHPLSDATKNSRKA